jgi:DNA-directed RNA polymerase specialized sigma subunit
MNYGSEHHEELLEYIANLSERERSIATLYYLDDMTAARIITIFGFTIKEVLKVVNDIKEIINGRKVETND